jgi:hypothetical protein
VSGCLDGVWLQESLTESNKFGFLYQIYLTGDVNSSSETHLNALYSSINDRASGCDIDLAQLIRVLYVNFDDDRKGIEPPYARHVHCLILTRSEQQLKKIESLKTRICNVLMNFPYWPTLGGDNEEMSKLEFWEENHLFLSLSSAVLFYQHLLYIVPHKQAVNGNMYMNHTTDSMLEQSQRFTKLLVKYLDIHLSWPVGLLYEVSSPVYNCRTICALMNLMDFSLDFSIREKSEKLLDRIVYQLMLGTDSTLGIGTLTGEFLCMIIFVVYNII